MCSCNQGVWVCKLWWNILIKQWICHQYIDYKIYSGAFIRDTQYYPVQNPPSKNTLCKNLSGRNVAAESSYKNSPITYMSKNTQAKIFPTINRQKSSGKNFPSNQSAKIQFLPLNFWENFCWRIFASQFLGKFLLENFYWRVFSGEFLLEIFFRENFTWRILCGRIFHGIIFADPFIH